MTEFFSTKIYILLIDSDVESLFDTAQFLDSSNCTVMPVEDSTSALRKLSKEKDNIDFVMSDVQTPGLDIFTLLKITSDLRLRTILTCPENDPNMVILGMEHGAFMVLEKPLCRQTIETLWQHVRRENILKMQAILPPRTPSFQTPPPTPMFEDIGSSGSADPRGKAPLDQDNECCGCKRKKPTNEGVLKVQEKVIVEWTEELHRKFMDAVTILGEGNCYAKDILDLMNVPGLTRVQVSSHLQKLRMRKWRPRSSSQSHALKRFGAMPLPINMPHYQTYTPNVALSRGASSSEGPRPRFRMRSQITASHLANILNGMQFGPPPGFPKRNEFPSVLNDMQFGPPLGFPKRTEFPSVLNDMHFGSPPGFPKRNDFSPAIANSMQRNAANGSGLPDLNEGGTFPTILPRIESLADPNITVRDIHETYPKPEPESDDDDDVYIYDGVPGGSSSDPNSTPHRYVPGGSSRNNVKKEP